MPSMWVDRSGSGQWPASVTLHIFVNTVIIKYVSYTYKVVMINSTRLAGIATYRQRSTAENICIHHLV